MTSETQCAQETFGITRIKLFIVAPLVGFAEVEFKHVSLTGMRLTAADTSAEPLMVTPYRNDRAGKKHAYWILAPAAWLFATEKLRQLWSAAQADTGERFPKRFIWVAQ